MVGCYVRVIFCDVALIFGRVTRSYLVGGAYSVSYSVLLTL